MFYGGFSQLITNIEAKLLKNHFNNINIVTHFLK